MLTAFLKLCENWVVKMSGKLFANGQAFIFFVDFDFSNLIDKQVRKRRMGAMTAFCLPPKCCIFEKCFHGTKKQKTMQEHPHLSSLQLQEKAKIEKGSPSLDVIRPCRVGDGIIQLTPAQVLAYQNVARKAALNLSYFVPASGSGSRMFQFLVDFLKHPTPENSAQTERFFQHLPDFALFRTLPDDKRQEYQTQQWQLADFAAYLLNPTGLNYGELPKALIPFHLQEGQVLNAVQEQVLQGQQLQLAQTTFHFTIQHAFKQQFESSLLQLETITGKKSDIRYSSQDPQSDAFAFTFDGKLALHADGSPIRRPAGHGTLLKNLEAIQSEYIFVKNIDNVQHVNKQEATTNCIELLLGLQHQIRQQLRRFVETNDFDGLCAWNQDMGLFDAAQLASGPKNWIALVNRPLRVCGMVKNEGQPGGGPFFVQGPTGCTKQIVEKAQLSQVPSSARLLLQSTHFNPVMMVLSPCDLAGNPHSLADFKDPEAYFVVEKNQAGQSIRFIEQPGLWNGSMAFWNTLFIEIPSAVFSPVKTVLDLLDPAHCA
ncbi:MAG: hypothetical protein RLZZ301_1087 [Bacteroidota bacterium]|jgi:hypothetical protein